MQGLTDTLLYKHGAFEYLHLTWHNYVLLSLLMFMFACDGAICIGPISVLVHSGMVH